MNISVEARHFIEAITSANSYEGDYGDCISNVDAILRDVDDSDKKDVPADYLEFLANFGFGELDAAFHVEDGLQKYSTIVGRETERYKDAYIFAGSSSGTLYAFDRKNHWSIIEISSESDDITTLPGDFSAFILTKLRYINELVDWREKN